MPQPHAVGPTRGTGQVPGVDEARALVYDLVVDAQESGGDVRAEAHALAVLARDAGWHDVRAIADYAAVKKRLLGIFMAIGVAATAGQIPAPARSARRMRSASRATRCQRVGNTVSA